MDRISLLCRTFKLFRVVLALIPIMHQLQYEGGYKLNKSKLTSAQESDSVLSCKKFQGFVLIYLLGWLCAGTKTIYHLELLLNILYN